MKKAVYNQNLHFEYVPKHKGAPYLMPDGHYYNAGDLGEASDKSGRGLDWHKDGNTSWDAGSDIELTHTSIKSSRFTLASDLKGESVEQVLNEYFARVASTNWDYVIMVDEQVWVYNMNATEFREFVMTFGVLNERKVVRGKHTSSKMIKWFEERV